MKTCIRANLYIIRLAWQIDRKRVWMELLSSILAAADYLVFGCLVVQFILELAAEGMVYSKMMLYLWGIIFMGVLAEIFQRYYQEVVKPATDVKLYDGIHKLLWKKACQVDITCYEDSDFYNEYMMAVSQAQGRVPESLHAVCEVAGNFLVALFGFAIIFQMDQYAIFLILFPILGNFLFYGILNSRIYRMEREVIGHKRIADYVNRTIHLAEYAKEMRMTKVFRLLKKQYDNSIKRMHRVIDGYALGNMVFYWLFQYFTFTLFYNGGNIYAGYRTLAAGTMVFAQFAIFQSTLRSNSWALLLGAEASMDAMKNGLYIEQVRKFLSYAPKIPEDQEGILPADHVETIEFSHVWFGYKEGEYILKDISFQIKRGSSLAVVGYNGAGKSTLMKLLLRLYDPDRGEILVNGIDIRKYQVRAYRSLFATAFQDGKIFADTVMENVLMGQDIPEKLRQEKVQQALRLAGMEEEVAGWEKAEATPLTREFSKEGRVLSGGQSQKILAARAFAKDSPVAVFDEPSSALDPLAEYQLFANIKTYSADKILFLISHRLSSVTDADMVLFMEHGRIRERGTHEELMGQQGEYAALYQLQAKNYQAESI